MKLISVTGFYYLFHDQKSEPFGVLGKYDENGFTFEPVLGWDNLSMRLGKPVEILMEEIDELIYNATPERYNEIDI